MQVDSDTFLWAGVTGMHWWVNSEVSNSYTQPYRCLSTFYCSSDIGVTRFAFTVGHFISLKVCWFVSHSVVRYFSCIPQGLATYFAVLLTVLHIQTDTNGGQCPTGLFFFSDSSPHTLCLNCQQQDCGAFRLPEGHPSSLQCTQKALSWGAEQTCLGGSGVDLAVAAAPGWVRTLLLNTWGTQRVCHQSNLSL